MTEKKPIYAVVMFPKKVEKNDTSTRCLIYSKQTSNKEKMIAFYSEIKNRHGENYKVYLVTRERAKEIRHQYYLWNKEREKALFAKLEGCSDRIATAMAREAYALTTIKK